MRIRIALIVAAALAVASCGDDGGGTPTGVPTPTENFDSGDISGGVVFVHTFTNNGDWAYRCKRHSGMTGVVRVSSAGVDSPSVAIGNNTFSPNLVIVKPGSYVKWTSNATLHTVTRP